MYFPVAAFSGFSASQGISQQRRGNHAGERGHIFSVTFSRRRNIVRHPTRQSQSGVLDRLRSRHRVINTAEVHMNYQYHRQLFLCYPIWKSESVRKRRKPAASTFH